MSSSKITTVLAVDSALDMGAKYSFNAADRRYLDNQVRGCETHLVDSLIGGTVATWARLDPGGASWSPGDVVTLGSDVDHKVVKLATAANLATGGAGFGVLLTTGVSGQRAPVAVSGVVPASVTGFASGAPGFARINTTTGKAERVASYSGGDYPLGPVDDAGNLALFPGVQATVIASGVPSLDTRLSTQESTTTSADTSLTTRVSGAESAQASGDTSLTTRLSNEESTGISRTGSIDSRSSAIESVDVSLGTRISASESIVASSDVSLTSRLSGEESTRLSQIDSVEALVGGGGGLYDEVITRTVTLTDANWTAVGAVYTMDASKCHSFTAEVVARDAGTKDAAFGSYKVAVITDGASASFVGAAAAATESVMSLVAGDDGDDGGAALGFAVKAVLSGLTIQFFAQATLYPGDITVRARIGVIKDS
jgi:hypothetical protein